MTVAELSRTMTAAEETHWIALYKQEPFGYDRTDLGFAQVCSIIWNSKVKREDARPLTDFLPFYRKRVKKDPDIDQSIRDVFSKIKGK